jgi:hypothetical protein
VCDRWTIREKEDDVLSLEAELDLARESLAITKARIRKEQRVRLPLAESWMK